MGLENLPIADWPNESGGYKVVQLEIHGKPHLRFGRVSSNHSDILRWLLGEDWKKNIITIRGSDEIVPAPSGVDYKVDGMGYARVNMAERWVFFHDRSSTYDMSISKEHLDSIRNLVPDWKIEQE